MRNVENFDFSLFGEEVYFFSLNDTLSVNTTLRFNQEDECFKCTYEFSTSYKALYKVDNNDLIIKYIPDSFDFISNDSSFHIKMIKVGNPHKLDSIKSRMKNELTTFFEETMRVSFDSIYTEEQIFTINYVRNNHIRLQADNSEITLKKIDI